MSIHSVVGAWRRRPWLGLVLITVLAAALRLPGLARIPPGFHYDEALEALEAWRVITRPDYHPVFFPGDFGLPAMLIYLESFAFRVFPPTPVVSRAVAALIGILTIPAVYALGQELVRADARLPRQLPLLAAAVLAILRWHITFSRAAIEPILVPLFLTLILWTLLAGLRTNRLTAWSGLGAALGLSVYTYPAAWLFLPLVGGILIYLRLAAPRQLVGRGLLLATLIAALLIAPLAVFFLQHPAQMMLRSGQVIAIQPGQPLRAILSTLGGNMLKVLGMFSVAGDADPRSNIPGRPALDPLLAIPFYLGLMVALRRWKQPAIGALFLASAAMLLTTTLSEYAPHFRRALGITPVIALLSGLGLAVVGAYAPSRSRRPAWKVVGVGMAALLLLGSAAWNIRDYFIVWGRSADLFYAYDEGLWEIGQYAQTLPVAETIYLSPRPASDATLAFAWRAGPTVRHFDGRSTLITQAAFGQTLKDATYIVIEHEDFRGSGLLQQLYGDAQEIKTFLDRDGRVYARAFQVPAGVRLGRQPTEVVRTRWSDITLWGYELNAPLYHPGEIIYLQLWWRAAAAPTTDWTVFTHVLGPAKADGSTLWAGNDARPGQGSAPTTSWLAGDLILDEHQIRLPADLPSGEYEIEVGLYDPAADNVRAISQRPRGADAILLGKVIVQ